MTATAYAIKNPTAPATRPQAELIARKLGVSPAQFEGYVQTVMANRTKAEASARIDELIAAEKVAKSAAEVAAIATHIPALAPAADSFKIAKGQWHVLNGKLYLIAKSQTSGYLYAKERNLDGYGGFDGGKGVVKFLNGSTLVSVENGNLDMIKSYGDLHHKCVFCQLPLDLPESRTAGYGEKCASNNGLPWGN